MAGNRVNEASASMLVYRALTLMSGCQPVWTSLKAELVARTRSSRGATDYASSQESGRTNADPFNAFTDRRMTQIIGVEVVLNLPSVA